MNDVNYDVLDRSKDIHSYFQCKQMSTYVDILIMRYRAFQGTRWKRLWEDLAKNVFIFI